METGSVASTCHRCPALKLIMPGAKNVLTMCASGTGKRPSARMRRSALSGPFFMKPGAARQAASFTFASTKQCVAGCTCPFSSPCSVGAPASAQSTASPVQSMYTGARHAPSPA